MCIRSRNQKGLLTVTMSAVRSTNAVMTALRTKLSQQKAKLIPVLRLTDHGTRLSEGTLPFPGFRNV